MRFISTRGDSQKISGTEAVLKGLASDGGLFMPDSLDFSNFDWKALLNLSAMEMEEKILGYFLDDYEDMHSIVQRAYTGKFDTEELTPLKKVGDKYVLELFHGPTSAFKDVALSVLPVLMEDAKKQNGVKEETVVLVATSGDTGSSALAGFKDRENIRIMVFFPENGVSKVQKAQMVTAEGENVASFGLEGNFDDTQTGVKKIFLAETPEKTIPEGFALSSANSINIGRLAPQIMYYFKAYKDLLEDNVIRLGDVVDFTVPTGNFGDIFAGYLASMMGLPVRKLICASNDNNVLTDFFKTGKYDKNRTFYKTTSPSMDILVSSNLERLLYVISDEDTAFVKAAMEDLSSKGEYVVPEKYMDKINEVFVGDYVNEKEVEQAIAAAYEESKYVMDTHTAVAWKAAERFMEKEGKGVPMVVLSTASPYKFSASVMRALGQEPSEDEFETMARLNALSGVAIPKNLACLQEKTVRFKEVTTPECMHEFVVKQIKKEG